MKNNKEEMLAFEREAGGEEGELTVICEPANTGAENSPAPSKIKKPVPALSAEQQHICDHATD